MDVQLPAMGTLDSYDINNLLNAGVSTDDIMNCGYMPVVFRGLYDEGNILYLMLGRRR